eukprot:TRINITY_DN1264_c0_g1_i1.p1 TRINITY_DN1264_c0_g1~~TRINITY_DN1264_c0_g1_i1.p1  ORF type:complete len:189 (+),score=44.05 TRINITY_DN1264_c0_g1_i1:174-740(+)
MCIRDSSGVEQIRINSFTLPGDMEAGPSESVPELTPQLAVQQRLIEWGIREVKAQRYAQMLIKNEYSVDRLPLLTEKHMEKYGFADGDITIIKSIQGQDRKRHRDDTFQWCKAITPSIDTPPELADLQSVLAEALTVPLVIDQSVPPGCEDFTVSQSEYEVMFPDELRRYLSRSVSYTHLTLPTIYSV